MRKLILAIVCVLFLVPVSAQAVEINDSIALTINSLENFTFNVVEESLDFTFTSVETGWKSEPFSFIIGGGAASGTARIYASSESSTNPTEWAAFVTGNNLMVDDLVGNPAMNGSNTPISTVGLPNTSGTQITGTGFVYPMAEQTVSLELKMAIAPFYSQFGAEFVGTVDATLYFLAVLE